MEITKENIISYIDHTDVRPDATVDDIKKLCEEAKKYGFQSVCVTPYRVEAAFAYLEDAPTEVISVIGFPFGISKTAIKATEAKIAVDDGASEIDMVANIGAIKEKNFDFVEEEIRHIVRIIDPIPLKVIMEVGFLEEEELREACHRAKAAGAAFVKSSTGYGPRPTKPEDIKIMRQAVREKMGVKASGGIHTFEEAVAMINAGATRIGTSSALEIIGVENNAKLDKSHSNE